MDSDKSIFYRSSIRSKMRTPDDGIAAYRPAPGTGSARGAWRHGRRSDLVGERRRRVARDECVLAWWSQDMSRKDEHKGAGPRRTERRTLMSAPAATALDQRYSDPQASPVDWDETRRALEAAELFWISTVRADGRPHVTPVVAVWLDGALHFHTGPEEQKAINLRSNPNVVLTTGCNSWTGGLDVVLDGEAVRVTDEAVLGRLAEVWARKWDGRWQLSARDGGYHHEGMDGDGVSHVFSVTPSKVYAHAKGDPFGATTHRF